MVKHTNSKVPQIRFKGFESVWVKDRLDERVGFFKGLTYSPCNVQNGIGTLVLRSSNVKNGEIVNADNVYVDSKVVDSKFVEIGDIAVVVRNGSRSLIGKHAQIKTRMDNTVIGAFMTGIHSENPAFTNALLDTPQFDKEIAKNSGATINQITTGAFKEMMFHFPNPTEQAEIGTYFRELDSLIGLHQRKHDKLVTLKKAMFQKMFPQPGADTPEIRFEGFSGAWVEKELGDLIDLGSGRDYKHLSPGRIPVYGTGGYMLSVNESLSASMDAVGIGRKGTIDKPYILRAPFWTVDTLFYAIPKAENYLDFVYCIFQRIDWKQRDESTGVPSLSKVAINGASVLSTNSPEQQKIGSYFRTLDELISQHATQLQKLQQIKSACLEKMFV